MKMPTKTLLTAAAVAATLRVGSADAAVLVTDSGLTPPTIGANDTGYTGTTNQRFGWDSGEGFTQSFTVANAGTIGSIYIGYNAFEDGDTITLTLSVNGSSVQTGIVLDGDDFSGTTLDGNGGPNYWMEFDLSAENVSVTAGSNNFTLVATANTGTSWAFGPRFSDGPNPYSGGGMSGAGTSNFISSQDDMAFAVTVVPEPGSLAFLGLGGLLIARRRRG